MSEQTNWTPREISGLTAWVEYSERIRGYIDMLTADQLFLQESGKEPRMPTSIKLYDLVAIPNTQHLWPHDFAALVKAWEETKNNNQLGIIADWLDDNNEPELAHAFRWCYNRKIEIKESGFEPRYRYIEKTSLPSCLQYENNIMAVNDRSGVCGVIAHLADMFADIREAIA